MLASSRAYLPVLLTSDLSSSCSAARTSHHLSATPFLEGRSIEVAGVLRVNEAEDRREAEALGESHGARHRGIGVDDRERALRGGHGRDRDRGVRGWDLLRSQKPHYHVLTFSSCLLLPLPLGLLCSLSTSTPTCCSRLALRPMSDCYCYRTAASDRPLYFRVLAFAQRE